MRHISDVIADLPATFVEEGEMDCWIWQGRKHTQGYGLYRHYYVHRLSYEEMIGPIPEGLEIDHLCRNRPCLNPGHLEAVTHYENIMRGESIHARRARQTHCKRGHPLNGDNLQLNWRGQRSCKRCSRQRAPKYYPPKASSPSLWPSRNPETAARIEELYATGMAMRQIALKVGISYSGVVNHLRRVGLR